MKKALYITNSFERIYGPDEQRDIAALVDVYAPPQSNDVLDRDPGLLADLQVVFSGWGAPRLDEVFLGAAPNLEAFFYGAGSIKSFVTDAFWDRNIPICSAWAANALPVAEFALSQILFCLKHGYQAGWHLMRNKSRRGYDNTAASGGYRSTVGIVSLGMIGRRMIELLAPFDLDVIAYDPFATGADAAMLGIELVSLDDVFRRSDVVSLHTPLLDETHGMLTGQHFELMKQGATFINTARGAIVREEEMIDVLARRPDLFAVLDVTYPEPPKPDSPMWDLPNVFLTPHLAGSQGRECYRMGRYMVDELTRFLNGETLQWQVSREKAQTMA